MNDYLGIDSTTNMGGAMAGDLDPMKGMYWTWQSGYINFKLEGSSNLCPTFKNEFQFHFGGYAFPNNALQTIILNVNMDKNISIEMDISAFLKEINLEKENLVMSPSQQVIELSKKVASIFKVKEKAEK